MAIRSVPDADLQYYLIAYDAKGKERTDDPDGLMSEVIGTALASEATTDIFILSHGWKGDVPAAIDQYDRWIKAMAQQQADLNRMRQQRQGFKPLLIGFHWPSQPWGEEEIGGMNFSFTAMPSAEEMIEAYANRIADTPAARQALRTIIESAAQNLDPPSMPAAVHEAYQALNQEAGLGEDGVAAAPGGDREPFDPAASFQAAKMEEAISFGGFGLGGLLSPLRQLSFWKMKDRARAIGETSGAHLLRQALAQSGDQVRVHLMGHSFGCIVVSAMLKGTDGLADLSRPVDSVAFIQGALSLWSYCEDIPKSPGKPGYFRPIIGGHKVRGPIITTQSFFDTAVGKLYPLGAGVAGQVIFAPNEYPKYGALGAFGARGSGLEVVDLKMLPATNDYSFAPGKIYNLESSEFINTGGGASGAHNDIAKPEVAHAVWQAAMVTDSPE